MILDYVIIATFVGLLVLFVGFAYRCERRAWNGGRCRLHGFGWVHFDNDSQGGRGYKCGHEGRCIVWISYTGVDTTTTGLHGIQGAKG